MIAKREAKQAREEEKEALIRERAKHGENSPYGQKTLNEVETLRRNAGTHDEVDAPSVRGVGAAALREVVVPHVASDGARGRDGGGGGGEAGAGGRREEQREEGETRHDCGVEFGSTRTQVLYLRLS